MCLFLVAWGLRCCTQAVSSCGERGLLSRCRAQASLSGGFSRCRAQARGSLAQELQLVGSVNVAHWLSRPEADGILPEQESNLHCHVDF